MDLERSLGSITMAPYIVKAMALIGVKRKSGSNMFRHQLSTMAILLDYKVVGPVLLKASVIFKLMALMAGHSPAMRPSATINPAPTQTSRKRVLAFGMK